MCENSLLTAELNTCPSICFLTLQCQKVKVMRHTYSSRLYLNCCVYLMMCCTKSTHCYIHTCVHVQCLVISPCRILKPCLSAFQRGLFSFVIKPHYFFITDLVEPSLLNWIIGLTLSWTFNTALSVYCSVFLFFFFFNLYFENVSRKIIDRYYFLQIILPCPRKAVL